MQFKGTGTLLVKDLDTKRGIVQAYWNAFNNIDDQKDIAEPGCWGKSIRERGPQSHQPRIKFLYQHQETMLLGKPSELVEDSFGLLATCPIVPTALGRDCLVLYEAGVITDHSVGYEVVQSQWDPKTGARRLIECSLWEGSAVTWGANPNTPVVAIKSLMQPAALSEMAARAQRLDALLHNGSLHSDALCETLDRELKALHAALAPADAPAAPYTIQGVLDSMSDLADRLATKATSADDKKAQEARAKKYGIGIKDGGNVTQPTADKGIAEEDYGDPVNFRYPCSDKAHADNAAARFAAPSARADYTAKEQDIIAKRIMAKQKSYGEEPDWWPLDDGAKGANMDTETKATDDAPAVSADGTHAAMTGTHTHSHKAFGSQGGDAMHGHEHTHADDAKHDHDHGEKTAPQPAPKAAAQPSARKTPEGRAVRKARDFDTLFQSLNAADELQDDWGDTFIAFVNAMSELMWQASAVTNGWSSDEDAKDFDAQEATQANLTAFGKAVLSLVQRSVAADFVPQMTHDCDQFIDPDGTQDDDDDDEVDGYLTIDLSKSRRNSLAPKPMPDAPAPLRKAGRAIGSANRAVITKALDGMSEAMKSLKSHHGTIADLMTKTDPDAVRQDEDTVLGDDDTENGGTNPNKSRFAPRPAPDRHEKAGTTHQGMNLSELDSDLDALRRKSGRKAS